VGGRAASKAPEASPPRAVARAGATARVRASKAEAAGLLLEAAPGARWAPAAGRWAERKAWAQLEREGAMRRAERFPRGVPVALTAAARLPRRPWEGAQPGADPKAAPERAARTAGVALPPVSAERKPRPPRAWRSDSRGWL